MQPASYKQYPIDSAAALIEWAKDTQYFTIIPDSLEETIEQDTRLTKTQKKIFFTIIKILNKRRVILGCISYAEIARISGCSIRTVIRAIPILRVCEFLFTKEILHPRGIIYEMTINLPKAARQHIENAKTRKRPNISQFIPVNYSRHDKMSHNINNDSLPHSVGLKRSSLRKQIPSEQPLRPEGAAVAESPKPKKSSFSKHLNIISAPLKTVGEVVNMQKMNEREMSESELAAKRLFESDVMKNLPAAKKGPAFLKQYICREKREKMEKLTQPPAEMTKEAIAEYVNRLTSTRIHIPEHERNKVIPIRPSKY